ncbi:MAG: MATE family efflux transporter [Saprospiraceae bacterium]|nr:MATE family efflux transporter [Saprospiraceae bacterium]
MKFLQLLKDAVLGKEEDFTKGSINRAIFLLAVPMIIEMGMESIFAVVDAYFVAKISVNAIATVGLTESVMTLIYSMAMGTGMAATAMISRRVGEKDPEKASKAAAQVLLLVTTVGLALGSVGFLFAKDILRLMGGSEVLVQEGYQYTQIMFGLNIVIFLLFVLNAIFRGAGNAAIAMRTLILANGLNIILDPCLIFGIGFFPEMGVKGAAVATVIGRSVGVVYQLAHLFNGKSVIKILSKYFRPKRELIQQIISLSLGGIGQMLIASASWIFLIKIVMSFGEAATAGYTLAIRILIFTILPAWGLANAAATLVGQNLGAQQPERAEASAWKSAKLNMYFLLVVAVIYFIFAEPLLAFFSSDPEVIFHGKNSLKIFSVGYVVFAYGMVLSQAFNGAGDTKTPTWVNFICFWMIEIPLAYFLAKYLDSPKGVFWAVVIAETIMAIILIWLFRKGRWKLKKV